MLILKYEKIYEHTHSAILYSFSILWTILYFINEGYSSGSDIRDQGSQQTNKIEINFEDKFLGREIIIEISSKERDCEEFKWFGFVQLEEFAVRDFENILFLLTEGFWLVGWLAWYHSQPFYFPR